MTRKRVHVALAAMLAVGAVLRLLAWQFGRPIHPDEFFQYLEPAWWHLTGLGSEAWEWRDGVRSWVLPIYNGAWMAFLRAIGVERGAIIGAALQIHWAVINLVLVLTAYRGGALVQRRVQRVPWDAPRDVDAPPPGFEAGLLAALACALWPMLIEYAAHTLSEMPSMLCLVHGLVLTGERRERPDRFSAGAALAGALISLGVCLRIANGPLALVAPVWLLVARRPRACGALVLGALVPVLVFGLTDLATWGRFGGSFIAYVKFNFIEGRAAEFGTQPWWFYADRLFFRAPVGVAVMLWLLLHHLRAVWPFAISALGLLAYLSTQAHKEERFVVAFWPFALIAAAGVAGAWLAPWDTLASRLRSSWPAQTALVVLLAVLGDAARTLEGDHFGLERDRYIAQAHAGQRPDVTGFLVDDGFFVGGALWFGRPVPQIAYTPELLDNPVFNYALLRRDSEAAALAAARGFREVFRKGDFIIYRRQP